MKKLLLALILGGIIVGADAYSSSSGRSYSSSRSSYSYSSRGYSPSRSSYSSTTPRIVTYKPTSGSPVVYNNYHSNSGGSWFGSSLLTNGLLLTSLIDRPRASSPAPVMYDNYSPATRMVVESSVTRIGEGTIYESRPTAKVKDSDGSGWIITSMIIGTIIMGFGIYKTFK